MQILRGYIIKTKSKRILVAESKLMYQEDYMSNENRFNSY